MAMMLKAVGMTQLAEPVTHGQPYLSGSKRTLRSEVLNFHRQKPVPLSASLSTQPSEGFFASSSEIAR